MMTVGHVCGKHGRCPCNRFRKIQKPPLVTAEIIKQCSTLQLEAAKQLRDDTWLTSRDEDGEPFSVGCAICSSLLMPCDQDVWGRFEVETVEGLKPYRLKAHASSQAHESAVLRLLDPSGADPQVSVRELNQAPQKETYETLLAWVRKGGSMRDGVANVGHFKKVKMMSWTLAEGLRQVYREWLGSCDTIALLRDERHGRLLVRFRCANLSFGCLNY